LGFAKMVHLDKENFIGKRALERDAKNGVPRQLAGLVVDWTDVEQLYERYGLTPAAPAQASRVAVPVYSGEKQVGKATTTTWSPTLKKMIALASLETGYAKPGTPLQMEITIEAMRMKANVQVTTLPFFNPPRKTATPV
jgi:aminomethyltransferase